MIISLTNTDFPQRRESAHSLQRVQRNVTRAEQMSRRFEFRQMRNGGSKTKIIEVNN